MVEDTPARLWIDLDGGAGEGAEKAEPTDGVRVKVVCSISDIGLMANRGSDKLETRLARCRRSPRPLIWTR